MDTFVALVSAEAGWRALFGDEAGYETGRSRVIAWGAVEGGRIVGIIADPNNPKLLVSAESIVDEDGGSLMRYGYAEA